MELLSQFGNLSHFGNLSQLGQIGHLSVPRSKTHPIIAFSPSYNDVLNDDGKFVFVGKVYGTKRIDDCPEKVSRLLEALPRYDEKQLRSCPDGVYCWLLYDVAETEAAVAETEAAVAETEAAVAEIGTTETAKIETTETAKIETTETSNNNKTDPPPAHDIRFKCTQVVSPFEIGTRHQTIAFCVNARNVYGGGELIKEGTAIRFNLFSGTYSRPIIRLGYSVDRSDIRTEIEDLFNHFLPDAVRDKDALCTSDDSYILNVRHVPNRILDLYASVGYVVRIFDTHNGHAEFHNDFWHLDFNLEYYDKQLRELKEQETSSDSNTKKYDHFNNPNQLLTTETCTQRYIESLSQMIALLER